MVLLVEDDSNDAELILRILRQQVPAGSIRHVSDGDAAIELLRHWDGEPLQLILLDLHLPTVSGLDVLKQLRSANETRHVPVVVMSGSSDADDVARSYDLGANSFLSKTDRAAQFEETIRQIAPYWLELNHPYIPQGTSSGAKH
jgi:two-component system response regulator